MGLVLALVRSLLTPRVDPRRLIGAATMVVVAVFCVPIGFLLLVAAMSVGLADLMGVPGGLALSGLLTLLLAGACLAAAARLSRRPRRPMPPQTAAGGTARPPPSPATLLAAAVIGVAAGLSPRLRRIIGGFGP